MTTELPAGRFSVWLGDMQAALRGEGTANVPCDGCTACCQSSQFVHIAPDEQETLARIPPQLLFPAPRLPPGHVVLGYDRHGHCPMLVDGGCSIYEHRPRTCRNYDCRVFAATGLEPDDAHGLIAERVRRWRFEFVSDEDGRLRDAVRAAARYVQERDGAGNATGRAAQAVEEHEAFLREGPHRGSGDSEHSEGSEDDVPPGRAQG